MRFLIVLLIICALLGVGAAFMQGFSVGAIELFVVLLSSAIPLLVIVWAFMRIFGEHNDRPRMQRNRAKEDYEEEMRDINDMLARMEDRIEALETILIDQEKARRS